MSDEPAPKLTPKTNSEVSSQVEKLEKVLSDIVPEPKREEVIRSIHEIFMAFVAGGSPKIDPETAKILVNSIDRDNQNKFEYLSQKQRDTAAQSAREHDLEVIRHKDRMTLARPAIYAAILVIIGTSAAGIWLAATGRETLGPQFFLAFSALS